MSIKKLILNFLLFVTLSNLQSQTICMAADEKPNLIENMLANELLLSIFEHCFNSYDIYDYFIEAIETVKTISEVDKRFNSFIKKLVKSVRRIARNRFLKAHKMTITDGVGLSKEAQLIDIFNQARNSIKFAVEFNEDELRMQAALLILEGVKHNILVEYDNQRIGHKIKISILQFIARTNLFIKLIPILIVYGLDIDEKDILGTTALILAGILKHEEAVRMICKCGADIDIQNNSGDSVLTYLEKQVKKCHFNALELNEYNNLIKILKEFRKQK